MNRLRLIKTAYTALAALMLVACASDELADGTVQDLPEGKYPLQISSVTMTAESTAEPWGASSPQTRVAENTTDGTSSVWTNGDGITVQIDGDNTSTGTYKVQVDASGNVTGLTAETALYWKNTTAQKVKGWYPTDITNDIDLKNQSTNLAYALYAETAGTVDYQMTSIELPFTHQLAKIRVVLDGLGKENVTDVKVYTYSACQFTPNDAAKKITGSGTLAYIPMKKMTYNNGATYCWEANVVPGSILRDNAFQLVVDEKTVECSIAQVTPQAGQLHIITLTVIEKYNKVDVSNISGTEYTVNGKVHLIGNKTLKTLKLTMEADSKLLLEDIHITAPDNSNAITCEGNATITLQGENTLSGKYSGTDNGYSAILVNSGTLTISGNDGDKLIATGVGRIGGGAGIGTINGAHIIIKGGHIIANGGTEAAGIGCAGFNRSGGDITIKGGIIEATGGKYSAGIGGSSSGTCGDIIITGGNIKAIGGYKSPGIGCGDNGACKDLIITGGTIVATKGTDSPSSIGACERTSPTGTVTIDRNNANVTEN